MSMSPSLVCACLYCVCLREVEGENLEEGGEEENVVEEEEEK